MTISPGTAYDEAVIGETPSESEPTPEPEFDFSAIRMEETDEKVTPPRPSRQAKDSAKKAVRTKAKATAPPYRKGKYVKPLMQLYGYASIGISFADPVCGKALMESAEGCARAWDELAEQNLAVRRVLQTLIEGGAWSGVAVAHLPLLIAVLGHHGSVPESVVAMFASEPEGSADEAK